MTTEDRSPASVELARQRAAGVIRAYMLNVGESLGKPTTIKDSKTLQQRIAIDLVPRLSPGCSIAVATWFDRPTDKCRIRVSVSWEGRFTVGYSGAEVWAEPVRMTFQAEHIAIGVHESWHPMFPGFIKLTAEEEGKELTDRQFAARMRSRRQT